MFNIGIYADISEFNDIFKSTSYKFVGGTRKCY